MDERLLSALIGLARATEGNEELITEETKCLLFRGLAQLFSGKEEGQSIGEACRQAHQLTELLVQIREEKKRLVPNCFDCASPCGRTADYDMQEFWDVDEERLTLKLSIVECLNGIAKGAEQQDTDLLDVCLEALIVLGWNGSPESLIRIKKKLD